MATLTGLINNLFAKKETSCLACGDCCRRFSWHLTVSDRDLDRWREEGREDLIARVNHLGWIWVDPVTKERLPVCPYLKETSPEKAVCGIHDTKPEICRAYPTHETRHRCIRGIHIN